MLQIRSNINFKVFFYAFLLFYSIVSVTSLNNQNAKYHKALANDFLAKMQLDDALLHFNLAADSDPSDYLILFKRATIFLAKKNGKKALFDLNRIVELKKDFYNAYIQRGIILLKQGYLEKAKADFLYVIENNKNNFEAKNYIKKIQQLSDWLLKANQFIEKNDCEHAEIYLNKLINESEWCSDLHRKRSKCYLTRKEIKKAISDMRIVTKLDSHSTTAFFEISEMYYIDGDVENSLSQIRECLKLDPDNKNCFSFYKRIKKLANLRKELEKASKKEEWINCLKKGQEILKFDKSNEIIQLAVYQITCKCNLKLNHIAEAIQECTEYLENYDNNNLDALLDRGEAYIISEEYEKAIADFKKAKETHEESSKAQEAYNRAQKILKTSKKKDYYKILGVDRHASKEDIMKAYRILARKWHPDNFHIETEKKKAQEKFIAIASAKEVLTNPEKRKIYDSGVDPLDPQAEHEGHHNGFQWGDVPISFPFSSGGSNGYTFKFHFG